MAVASALPLPSPCQRPSLPLRTVPVAVATAMGAAVAAAAEIAVAAATEAAVVAAVSLALEEEAELAAVPPAAAVDLLVMAVVLVFLDATFCSFFHCVNFYPV